MAIIAKAGAEFQPAPAGLHQGVCVDVVDMGVVETTWQGQTSRKHMVRLVWQLDAPMGDGRPFIVQRRYTLSLHKKSALRKDLEAWRGRAFTDEELRGFDLEKLIGANGQINVQHDVKDGSTFANVNGIVPLGRGMAKLTPRDYVRVCDRDDAPHHEVLDDDFDSSSVPF